MSLKGYIDGGRPTPEVYGTPTVSPQNIFEITISNTDRTATLSKFKTPKDEKERTGELVGLVNRTFRDTIIHGWDLYSDVAREEWENISDGIDDCQKLKTEVTKEYEKSEEKRIKTAGKKEKIEKRQYNHLEHDHIWVAREYMIGPEEKKALPYVTILSTCPPVSEVIRVEALRIVGDWKKRDKTAERDGTYDWGVVKIDLRGIALRVFGGNRRVDSGKSSPENAAAASKSEDTDEANEFETVEVEVTGDDYPVMTNARLSSWLKSRHRCGIRLEVGSEPETSVAGTLGGIISIDGELYGLTVGHIFSSAKGGSGGKSDVTAGVHGKSDQSDGKIEEEEEEEEEKKKEEEEEEEEEEEKEEEEEREEEEEEKKEEEEEITNGNQWRGRDLDWALVKLPGLGDDAINWGDMNLVRTASGDFCPMTTVPKRPPHGTMVVLATPASTYGLRGFLVGSDALVGFPGLKQQFRAWVVRMEYPWLIRDGDSGSWAFDAQTGNLLGILVAGCPLLLEAYIVPADQVFNDIEKTFNHERSINLANNRWAPTSRSGVQEIIKSYQNLADRITKLRDPLKLEGVGYEINEWETSVNHIMKDSESLLSRDRVSLPTSLDNPSAAGSGDQSGAAPRQSSDWIKPYDLVQMRRFYLFHFDRSKGFLTSDKESKLLADAKAAVHQRPIYCYNSMNKLYRHYFQKWQRETLATRAAADLRYKKTPRFGPMPWDLSDSDEQIQEQIQRENAIIDAVWDHLVLDKDQLLTHSGYLGKYTTAEKIILTRTDINKVQYHYRPGLIYNSNPWDRYSLVEFIALLREDLTAISKAIKSAFDRELPGVDINISHDGPFILFGALVMTEKRDDVLMIVVPPNPGIGYHTKSNERLRKLLPQRYHYGGESITYNKSQIPFAQWDPSQDEDANIRRLLQNQLGLKEVQWKQKTQLDWEPDNGDGDDLAIKFYELIIDEEDWPSEPHQVNKSDWAVVPASEIHRIGNSDWAVSDFVEMVAYDVPRWFRKAFKAHYNI